MATIFTSGINGASAITFLVISLMIVLHSLRCIYATCVRRRYIRRSTDQQEPFPHQELLIAIHGAPQQFHSFASKTGLDPSVIASLPTFFYKKPNDQIDGTGTDTGGTGTTDDCSICLSTIEEEEMVRLLPFCLHLFHAECIDMWLSSHLTCPICRTSVVAEPPQAPPPQVVSELEQDQEEEEEEEESSEAQSTTAHETRDDHEVTIPTAPPLNPSVLIPTSSEGTAQSSKVDASCSRPSSFRKILSFNRLGRRIQPFELSADGVLEDPERQ